MFIDSHLSDAAQATLARNNVHVYGNGSRPMIFSHGFGSDQTMWRYIAPHFADGWRIVLYDLVGSGRSDRTQYSRSRYDSLDGYAADLLEICETLDLRNAVFVGHSVSAMIGVNAANRDSQRIDSLIMLGPTPRFLNDTDYFGGFERRDIEELLFLLESNHEAWAAQFAPLAMANADRPELAQELANSFCNMDPAIAHHFAQVAFLADSRREAAACMNPALIVQCTHDVFVPVAVGDYLHRVMRNATLQQLDASGHFPHLSAPTQTARLMRDFLDQRKPGG